MTIRRFATNTSENKTLAQHSGNAIHGELVVDMDVMPPMLYVADDEGNLTSIGSVGTVSASDISIVVDNGSGSVQGGSQFMVNRQGNLVGSWLLAMEEDDRRIISQANAFVFGHGEVSMSGVQSVQLPDGGMLSPYNYFLSARNLNLINTDVLDSSGSPATHSIPVTINNQQYYIQLSTSP